MEFSRTIKIEEWNDQLISKIIQFWENREITFHVKHPDLLQGKRGSLWRNLITFYNMAKLPSELTILKSSRAEFVCTLNVNTTGQTIAGTNLEYWLLEMDTFVSWITNDDLKNEEWRTYRKGAAKAIWSEMLSSADDYC